MPNIEPAIRKPFVFKRDENLKRFILTKLINAEYASLKAKAFEKFKIETLDNSLKKLYNELSKLSVQFTGDDFSCNLEKQFLNGVSQIGDASTSSSTASFKSLNSIFSLYNPTQQLLIIKNLQQTYLQQHVIGVNSSFDNTSYLYELLNFTHEQQHHQQQHQQQQQQQQSGNTVGKNPFKRFTDLFTPNNNNNHTPLKASQSGSSSAFLLNETLVNKSSSLNKSQPSQTTITSLNSTKKEQQQQQPYQNSSSNSDLISNQSPKIQRVNSNHSQTNGSVDSNNNNNNNTSNNLHSAYDAAYIIGKFKSMKNELKSPIKTQTGLKNEHQQQQQQQPPKKKLFREYVKRYMTSSSPPSSNQQQQQQQQPQQPTSRESMSPNKRQAPTAPSHTEEQQRTPRNAFPLVIYFKFHSFLYRSI